MLSHLVSRYQNNQARFSKSEVVLSVVLVLVLVLVALPFFTRMLENIERTALQQIVRQLNAAAKMKMAEYVALDKLQRLPEQMRINPVNWLDIRDLGGWDRYKGEVEIVELVDFEQLGEQSWVFDKTTGRLIYKLAYPELLINEDPINNRIQFRVRMDYVDFDVKGKFDTKTDTITGLFVEAVYPYHWVKFDDR
ncbi:MAG: hypothetical protein COA74_07200 [Gammaproteobacteria bacterium]|nr:MAG: hypothetical protein COA74_07200 [Gammaproteobacteria bacterium]